MKRLIALSFTIMSFSSLACDYSKVDTAKESVVSMLDQMAASNIEMGASLGEKDIYGQMTCYIEILYSFNIQAETYLGKSIFNANSLEVTEPPTMVEL